MSVGYPIGIRSKVVGWDVRCCYLEAPHSVVLFKNSAVPRPGSTLRQVQEIDQKVWSQVHQAIQDQRRGTQVQWLQTSQVHGVPWFKYVFSFYGFPTAEVFPWVSNNPSPSNGSIVMGDPFSRKGFGMKLVSTWPFPDNQHVCLRSYPPAFGLKMAKLHPRFCASRSLWFGLRLEHDMLELGLTLFESLPWCDTDWWEDARMEGVFRYLRGSKDLMLSTRLRSLFPTEI